MAYVTRINGPATTVGTLFNKNCNLYIIQVKNAANSNMDLTKEDSSATGVTPIAATATVVNTLYRIVTLGNSDFTTIGAITNVVGTNFYATGVGTGTGTVSALGTTIEAIVDEISPLAYFTPNASSGYIYVVMDKSINDASELQQRIRNIALISTGVNTGKTAVGPNTVDISKTVVTTATSFSVA